MSSSFTLYVIDTASDDPVDWKEPTGEIEVNNIVHETMKAVLYDIQVTTRNNREVWIPKSLITRLGNYNYKEAQAIPLWFAKKEGLI